MSCNTYTAFRKYVEFKLYDEPLIEQFYNLLARSIRRTIEMPCANASIELKSCDEKFTKMILMSILIY